MSIKFTKTARGSEQGSETLLFQFLDHECPEKLPLEYNSDLVTNKFIGSLQTNQHNGVYLQPISWQGEFFGGYIPYIAENNSGQYMTAKERFDQLGRLQGRVIKFWYEGIKQLVIISKLDSTFIDYNRVEYSITLQPHDIQIFVKPEAIKAIIQKSNIQINTPTNDPANFKDEGIIQFDLVGDHPSDAKKAPAKPSLKLPPNFSNADVEYYKEAVKSAYRDRVLNVSGVKTPKTQQILEEDVFKNNPNQYIKQLAKDLRERKSKNVDNANFGALTFVNNRLKSVNTPQQLESFFKSPNTIGRP
jgi:hypothetical protein